MNFYRSISADSLQPVSGCSPTFSCPRDSTTTVRVAFQQVIRYTRDQPTRADTLPRGWGVLKAPSHCPLCRVPPPDARSLGIGEYGIPVEGPQGSIERGVKLRLGKTHLLMEGALKLGVQDCVDELEFPNKDAEPRGMEFSAVCKAQLSRRTVGVLDKTTSWLLFDYR